MLLSGGCGYEDVLRLLASARSSIGFDRIFDLLENARAFNRGQLAALRHREGGRGPPPHHRGGRRFLAGSAQRHAGPEPAGRQGAKPDDRAGNTFTAASLAALSNAGSISPTTSSSEGRLPRERPAQIELERELPEEMKPRRIEIQAGKAVGKGDKVRAIEHSKVA